MLTGTRLNCTFRDEISRARMLGVAGMDCEEFFLVTNNEIIDDLCSAVERVFKSQYCSIYFIYVTNLQYNYIIHTDFQCIQNLRLLN